MPRGKNANGLGSVYQRNDGYWVSSVSINGRRVVSYSKTKKEAQQKLNDALRQHQLGQLTAPSKMTVNDLTEQWLANVEGDLKPTALLSYRQICRLYIEPTVGHVKLHQLKPANVVSAIATWRKRNVASGTVLNAYRCLHRALECGVRWGLLAHNPCDSVEAPRVKRKEATIWTEEQAKTFLDATREDRYYPLWLFLIGTGCRIGEALALTWDDVDLVNATVSVRRSVALVGQRWVVQQPKTKASVRTVLLPSFVVGALRTWHKRQLEERLQAGPNWQDERRAVFLTSVGTIPLLSNLWRALQAACKKAGVPSCRVHDLRHLSATMLIASGLDPKSVQARLGHATINMTMNLYAHAIQSRDRLAAEAMDKALGMACVN